MGTSIPVVSQAAPNGLNCFPGCLVKCCVRNGAKAAELRENRSGDPMTAGTARERLDALAARREGSGRPVSPFVKAQIGEGVVIS